MNRFLKLRRLISTFGIVACLLSFITSTSHQSFALQQPVATSNISTLTHHTITLPPSKDNTLYEENSALSNGSGDNFYVGNTNEDLTRRAILAFDIAGNLPANAHILTTTLQLNLSKTRSSAPFPFSLHRLEQDWGESDSSGAGGGGNAKTGDATWIYTFYNTARWTTAGGDFVSTVSATTPVGGTGIYHWTDPQLSADVQSWLTDSHNYGWILIGNEGAAGTAKQFDSRENILANQPQLTITYTITTSLQPNRIYLPAIYR